MSESALKKLEALQQSFVAQTGRPFAHFFCPILHRDEPADLCEGHVVDQAFPGSDRTSVIQRRDVDSFFGSRFEADFVLLRHRGQHSVEEILLDRDLARAFRPRLTVNGQPLEHYLPTGGIPAEHSELIVERDGRPPIRLALKLVPSDTLGAVGLDWEIVLEKDVRLAALVSLLKAAHLTMFSLMGYSYALTTAGRFVGWDMLGQFAASNMPLDRQTVTKNAFEHFPEFLNLVRPMAAAPVGIAGTVTDQRLFLCTGSPKAWAFLVLVRTAKDVHAVLLPVMEDDESAARYLRFMKAPSPRFEVALARFAGDRWEVASKGRMIEWPEARFE